MLKVRLPCSLGDNLYTKVNALLLVALGGMVYNCFISTKPFSHVNNKGQTKILGIGYNIIILIILRSRCMYHNKKFSIN